MRTGRARGVDTDGDGDGSGGSKERGRICYGRGDRRGEEKASASRESVNM